MPSLAQPRDLGEDLLPSIAQLNSELVALAPSLWLAPGQPRPRSAEHRSLLTQHIFPATLQRLPLLIGLQQVHGCLPLERLPLWHPALIELHPLTGQPAHPRRELSAAIQQTVPPSLTRRFLPQQHAEQLPPRLSSQHASAVWQACAPYARPTLQRSSLLVLRLRCYRPTTPASVEGPLEAADQQCGRSVGVFAAPLGPRSLLALANTLCESPHPLQLAFPNGPLANDAAP
mmetsp:Transcript_26358/g.47497  ORF Transcript_26358/g.47497 Transcript_26358/m.47497 type:complete len:231 (-) Transcript_26358:185-877(-)